MRWRGKAAAALATAAAGGLVWAGLAFREASSAIELGREAVEKAGRIAFERRAWEPLASAFTIDPARQDLRDAAWFAGSLWLAGSGGLARYSPEGALERQWLRGRGSAGGAADGACDGA